MKEILGDVKKNRPNAYLVCLFLAYTGARRGEACGLQEDSISLDDRMVIIQDNYVRANNELILKPYTKNTQL